MTYRCAACGDRLVDWSPKCPCCGLRGAILADDQPDSAATPDGHYLESIRAGPVKLLPTGIWALDTLLGGGFEVPSTTFLGGPPGLGKSTLLLQALTGMAAHARGPLLYAACEESAERIKCRARDRVAIPRRRILVLVQPTLEAIGRAIAAHPRLVAVAVDTLHELTTEAPIGPRSRLTYCARQLVAWAQARDLVMLFLAHLSRKGNIAGSLTAEHLLDAVLHLSGRARSAERVLTASKIRWHSTDLAAVFTMTGRGLVNGRVLEPERDDIGAELAGGPAPGS